MVAGGHLDEGAAGVRRDAVDLGEERPADPAGPDRRIDHHRDHPGEVIVLLEAWDQVDGDEPESLAVTFGNPDQRPHPGESLQAAHDVAGPRRIALVREEPGNPVGVGRLGVAEDGCGIGLGHGAMVAHASPRGSMAAPPA